MYIFQMLVQFLQANSIFRVSTKYSYFTLLQNEPSEWGEGRKEKHILNSKLQLFRLSCNV
jgi:hypothetical protein